MRLPGRVSRGKGFSTRRTTWQVGTRCTSRNLDSVRSSKVFFQRRRRSTRDRSSKLPAKNRFENGRAFELPFPSNERRRWSSTPGTLVLDRKPRTFRRWKSSAAIFRFLLRLFGEAFWQTPTTRQTRGARDQSDVARVDSDSGRSLRPRICNRGKTRNGLTGSPFEQPESLSKSKCLLERDAGAMRFRNRLKTARRDFPWSL